MPEVDPVILQLKADLADYDRKTSTAVKLADQRLGQIEKRAGQMADTLSRGFSMAARAALSFGTAMATIETAKQIAGLVDSAKKIEAQLRLATKESGDFGKAQEDVRRIAATTRSELEATAQLYGNFQRNARELKITQEQAGRATETVAKAFKISGAGAVESSQGTRQLVQALQSGVLRGDEFNTIAEAAPRLQKLFADSLGVSQGALRKMAEEGKLTSAVLTKALTDKKFTAGIDAEFKMMPVTFDEAATQIKNSATIAFGAFDRGGEFSKTILNFVLDSANGFADIEKSAESFGRTVSGEIAGVTGAARELITTVQAIYDLFQSLAYTNPFTATIAAMNQLGLGKLTDIASYLNPLTLAAKGITSTPQYQNAKNEREGSLALAAIMAKGSLRDILPPEYQKKQPPLPSTPADGKGKKKKSNDSAARLAARQEAEGLRLGQEELRARLDLATDVGERADLAKEILAKEREEMLVRLKAQKILTPALEKQINELYGRPAEFDPKTGETTIQAKPGLLAQQINRDLEEQQQRMANDMMSRQADTLEALAGIEVSTRKRNELENAALDIQQSIQRNLLEQEIATGKIAEADAQRAREALNIQQSAARVQMQRSQMSPAEKYRFDLYASAENVNDAVEQIKVQGLESLNDGLTDAITGVRSLGDVFHQVAGQIVADLLRIALQRSVIQPLANMLLGGGSTINGVSGSSFAAGLGSTLSAYQSGLKIDGFRASGGPVSAGRTYMVGEEGPEILRMGGTSGHIIPNGKLAPAARGGTVIQKFSFDARGAVMTPELLAQMNDMVAQGAMLASASGAAEGERRVFSRSNRQLR